MFFLVRVPQEVDVAPRENCNEQKERSDEDDEPGRNVLSSPIRVDWFPAQNLTISVDGREDPYHSERQPLAPGQILA